MMFALMMYPLVGLMGTIAATALVWFTKPAIIIKYGMRLLLLRSGLKVKYVTQGGRKYCYAERGVPSANQPSMVFIHGFSASKDMWIDIVKKLPRHIHIVALDLPGHGDSDTPDSTEEISFFETYVTAMKEMISLCGVDRRPFHLVGTSMGGILAGLYAATYPEDLVKVSLICPAIRTPIETPFMHEVRSGYCRLIPDDIESLQKMINSCVYNKVNINKQILKGVMELRRPRNAFYKRLFDDIMRVEADPVLSMELEKKGNDIRMPLQVIWGKHDELIHPSGAEKLREDVASCVRVDMIERCGHSVNMDRPGSVVKVLLEFRGELQAKNGRL